MTKRWIPMVLLLVAGAALAGYPVLRGYGSEAGLAGAALYARPAWLAAHVLGMAGFALLAVGLDGVDGRATRWATWSAFLVLPYYGAEAFGLHALGRQVLADGQPTMIAAADGFRYETVALIMFALGWLGWIAVGVRLLVIAIRSADLASPLRRVGLGLVAVALVTYLPQFFGTPGIRIGHGFVLAAGLATLAISLIADREATSVPDYARQRAVVSAAR